MSSDRSIGAPMRATVVGGGPAGLMAAEVLAEAGLAVTVYEHMASMGRKFLLAGRGGLNITHSEPIEDFCDRYGDRREQISSMLAAFGPDDLRDWCGGLAEPTFVGSSGRVFPASFRATPLLRAWLARLTTMGVQLRVRQRWCGFGADESGATDPRVSRFVATPPAPSDAVAGVHSAVTVLALGGASWPRVGSTGAWVEEFHRVGVEVEPLVPANGGVRVEWTDLFADRYAGTPVKNIALRVAGDLDDAGARGDLMVTTNGVEGGPVYARSAALRRGLDAAGEATLLIDLAPDLEASALALRLEQRSRSKDSVTTMLRRIGVDAVAVSLMRDATANQLPRDPRELAALLKAVPVAVVGFMPIDRAISSAGGVRFDELDDALMVRRLPGVFVAGEMLDWEAPTGGYLLQASFASGVTAARGALAWLADRS